MFFSPLESQYDPFQQLRFREKPRPDLYYNKNGLG